MIEGLQFDVHAKEMVSHLGLRLQHHQERLNFYKDKADALEKDKCGALNYTNGDPVRSLRDMENKHLCRMQYFQFMKDHVVAGETYRLSESDLDTVEFISRRSW